MWKRKRRTTAGAFQANVFQNDAFQTEVKVLWDAASLTFAAVLYTAAITIAGVLVATAPLWGRIVYAVAALGLLALGLKFKRRVIRLSRRAIGPHAD